MELIICDSYEALSKKAADDLTRFVSSTHEPLVCTASGDSPAGLYRELAHRARTKELNLSHWYFVGLDEWKGMNGADEGSCRFHLDQQFFHPAKVEENSIMFFDGRSENPEEECTKTEDFIRQHGGIDVVILGLGLNGHVGMNEPGTSPDLRSHVTDIDPQTQQTGQKYFNTPQVLSHGITLGLATLMEARKILLIVNGAHKAAIVHKILKEASGDELPATLLLRHPDLTIYLDKEAAGLIEKDE